MTKSVRVVNADMSDYKVKVFVETKDASGNWVRNESTREKLLEAYTDSLTEYIHDGQRLVIEESR